ALRALHAVRDARRRRGRARALPRRGVPALQLRSGGGRDRGGDPGRRRRQGGSRVTAEDLVEEAGIRRLALATPLAVDRVNAYLIEDDPLTLVDPGPNSADTLIDLADQMRAHGHRIEDLGLI